MLDGFPLIDVHLHAASRPTLKLPWETWSQGFADAVFEPKVLARSLEVSLATAALALGVAALGAARERLAWRES